MNTINVRIDKEDYDTMVGPVKPKPKKPKAPPMPKAEQNALIDSWLFYWKRTQGLDYKMEPKDYAAVKKIGNYLESLSPEDHSPETINKLFQSLLNFIKDDKFYSTFQLTGFASQIQRISASAKQQRKAADIEDFAKWAAERASNRDF